MLAGSIDVLKAAMSPRPYRRPVFLSAYDLYITSTLPVHADCVTVIVYIYLSDCQSVLQNFLLLDKTATKRM